MILGDRYHSLPSLRTARALDRRGHDRQWHGETLIRYRGVTFNTTQPSADSLGLLLMAHGHAADITDCDNAQLLLERLAGAFPHLRHVWANIGKRGSAVEWIKARLGWTVESVQRPSKWAI